MRREWCRRSPAVEEGEEQHYVEHSMISVSGLMAYFNELESQHPANLLKTKTFLSSKGVGLLI